MSEVSRSLPNVSPRQTSRMTRAERDPVTCYESMESISSAEHTLPGSYPADLYPARHGYSPWVAAQFRHEVPYQSSDNSCESAPGSSAPSVTHPPLSTPTTVTLPDGPIHNGPEARPENVSSEAYGLRPLLPLRRNPSNHSSAPTVSQGKTGNGWLIVTWAVLCLLIPPSVSALLAIPGGLLCKLVWFDGRLLSAPDLAKYSVPAGLILGVVCAAGGAGLATMVNPHTASVTNGARHDEPSAVEHHGGDGPGGLGWAFHRFFAENHGRFMGCLSACVGVLAFPATLAVLGSPSGVGPEQGLFMNVTMLGLLSMGSLVGVTVLIRLGWLCSEKYDS